MHIKLAMERHALIEHKTYKTQWSEIGVESVISTFTDLVAVCKRIKLEAFLLQGGRGV